MGLGDIFAAGCVFAGRRGVCRRGPFSRPSARPLGRWIAGLTALETTNGKRY